MVWHAIVSKKIEKRGKSCNLKKKKIKKTFKLNLMQMCALLRHSVVLVLFFFYKNGK